MTTIHPFDLRFQIVQLFKGDEKERGEFKEMILTWQPFNTRSTTITVADVPPVGLLEFDQFERLLQIRIHSLVISDRDEVPEATMMKNQDDDVVTNFIWKSVDDRPGKKNCFRWKQNMLFFLHEEDNKLAKIVITDSETVWKLAAENSKPSD